MPAAPRILFPQASPARRPCRPQADVHDVDSHGIGTRLWGAFRFVDQFEIFAFARLTMSSIRAESLAMVAANSAGLSAMTVRPRASMRAVTVGSRSASTIEPLS